MRLYNQLMSSVAFAPEDEGKSAAQKERDAIKVESVEGKNAKSNTDTKAANEGDSNNDANGDKEDDEQEKEDSEKEGEKEDDEDEGEKEDDAGLKLQKENERLKRKLSKSEERRKNADKEARALKAKLETTPDKSLTEDDVESRAEAKAEAKALEKEFNAAQNRIIKSASKSDKEFMPKIRALADDIGPMQGYMIGILDDLDNGGEVIAHLVNNESEAEEIWELSAPKMAIALAKLSTKLERSKQKKISSAPAPINALGGNQTKNCISIYDKNWKGDDKDWIEQRNREVVEKQKNGRYNLR